jgi:hypothetical protein
LTTISLIRSCYPPGKGEYSVTNKSIFVRCLDCGQILTLDNHTVDPKGNVTPSAVCPYDKEGCGWHVYIKLEGWKPDE